MLAVAKDKSYALSGPSPGVLAAAKDRDNTKSKTEICENGTVCIVSGEGVYVGDRCDWDTRIRLYVL